MCSMQVDVHARVRWVALRTAESGVIITFEAQRVESYIHDVQATGYRHDDTSTI